MRLYIFWALVIIFIGLAMLSLFQAIALASVDLKAEEDRLAILDEEYKDLEAKYLEIVFDKVAPDAKLAGFVAVTSPRYLEPESVVAQR